MWLTSTLTSRHSCEEFTAGLSIHISPGSRNFLPCQSTYKFTDDSIRSIGSNDGRHSTDMQCQSCSKTRPRIPEHKITLYSDRQSVEMFHVQLQVAHLTILMMN